MDIDTFNGPVIIAHRGYKAKYPENTLSAFKAAAGAGAHMVELDVHLTGDRKLVVIHDETLERTTDGRGRVKGHSLEALKKLDAGVWFDPRFAGERIPTLSEVLAELSSPMWINIEIKASAYDPRPSPDSIESQVVETVLRENAFPRVLISSFESKILQRITATQPAPPVALISERPADQDTVRRCKALKVFSWHPRWDTVTGELIKRMHGENIRVFPYNIHSAGDFQRAVALGVDGVIIDDVALAGEQEPNRAGSEGPTGFFEEPN